MSSEYKPNPAKPRWISMPGGGFKFCDQNREVLAMVYRSSIHRQRWTGRVYLPGEPHPREMRTTHETAETARMVVRSYYLSRLSNRLQAAWEVESKRWDIGEIHWTPGVKDIAATEILREWISRPFWRKEFARVHEATGENLTAWVCSVVFCEDPVGLYGHTHGEQAAKVRRDLESHDFSTVDWPVLYEAVADMEVNKT